MHRTAPDEHFEQQKFCASQNFFAKTRQGAPIGASVRRRRLCVTFVVEGQDGGIGIYIGLLEDEKSIAYGELRTILGRNVTNTFRILVTWPAVNINRQPE